MDKNIENLVTYYNRNGYPILRRCKNCIFFNTKLIQNESENAGYCTRVPYYFAFTLTPNLYPITKDFYLCSSHKLYNEDKLKEVSDSVPLKEVIKNKEDIE